MYMYIVQKSHAVARNPIYIGPKISVENQKKFSGAQCTTEIHSRIHMKEENYSRPHRHTQVLTLPDEIYNSFSYPT